jgi:hypothetical protein
MERSTQRRERAPQKDGSEEKRKTGQREKETDRPKNLKEDIILS